MTPGTTIREDCPRTVAYQAAVRVRCAAVLMSMGHSPRRSCQHCGLPACCARLACRRSDVQSPVGARTAALHTRDRIQPLAPARRGLSCTSSTGCTPAWFLAPGAGLTTNTLWGEPPSLPNFLLSTSSSGQDVALWPRRPRFKSWCGHDKLQRCSISAHLLSQVQCCMLVTALQPRHTFDGQPRGRHTCLHERQVETISECPHRLVVRTSRCGRDNPGSNPGVDMTSYKGAASVPICCRRYSAAC